MKTNIRALFAVALLLGTAVSYTACSSDDGAGPGGPQNKPDSGGPGPGPGADAGGKDSGSPDKCTDGYDNTKIPGWPNNVQKP